MSDIISIIDYGAGNLTSVKLAFERVGAQVQVFDRADQLPATGKIVFPGVGAAATSMAGIVSRGFDVAIKQAVKDGRMVLGICVGMQMLLSHSEEDNGVKALDIIPGAVKKFDFPAELRIKVPQMGWNQVEIVKKHPILDNIPSNTAFYFVHSYYAAPESADHIFGCTDYAGCKFASIVGKNSLIATQFHPERSGEAGMQLLSNFVKL